MIVLHYSVIGAWVIKYLFEYLKGDAKLLATDTYFQTSFQTEYLQKYVLYSLLYLHLPSFMQVFKTELKEYPNLCVVLSVIIAGYSISRPGAFEGVKCFLIPNFDNFHG